MSWRDDHAGLARYACARDHNHSRSSGGGSMCAHNASEPVRTRQTIGQVHFMINVETLAG